MPAVTVPKPPVIPVQLFSDKKLKNGNTPPLAVASPVDAAALLLPHNVTCTTSHQSRALAQATSAALVAGFSHG